MQSRNTLRLATLLLALTAACGGGAAAPRQNANGRMTATIDGTSWASDPQYINQGVRRPAPGVYVLYGAKLIAGNDALAIQITLYNIRGPGTYALGMGPTTVGGIGVVAQTAGSWSTPLSGVAGTISITSLTSSRIAGTFAFTSNALQAAGPATRTVTNGSFELPISGASVGALPDEAGSSLSATLGGVQWTASTVAAGVVQGNALIITSNSTLNSLTMTLTGVTAPGTFPLTLSGGVRMIQVMGASLNPQNTDCCWGGTAASTGTITVTSLTATRVAGTFSATLAPLPGSHATGTLVVSNGSFDVGLPQP